MESWMQAVERLGFPIVAYGGIAVAVWVSLKWTASQIIMPLRDWLIKVADRGILFVDKVEGNVDKMSGHLEKQTQALNELLDTNREYKDAIQTLAQQGCGIAQAMKVRKKENEGHHGE